MSQVFYTGCVENRLDPLMLGRCQVRIVGLHTHDKVELPTKDLPWAHPMGPITSASMNGIGWSPTGIVQGTWVIIIFLDEYNQQPIMIGTIGGIPMTKSAALIAEVTNGVVTTNEDGELLSSTGDVVTDLVSQIADGITSDSGKEQAKGDKYQVKAITIESIDGPITTYNIVNMDNKTIIATGSFNVDTEKFEVTLLKPEQYTEEQYIPFALSKEFDNPDDISLYFDKNF
jgi:hypothetical protein